MIVLRNSTQIFQVHVLYTSLPYATVESAVTVCLQHETSKGSSALLPARRATRHAALPLHCHAGWGAAVAESSARTLCCSSNSASVRSSSSRGGWGRPSWSRPVALVMASFSSSSHISAVMSLDLCIRVYSTIQ